MEEYIVQRKQNSGSLNCIEIVANMITDANPAEFQLITKAEPPYSDYQLAYFLFLKGFQLTVGVPGESIQPMIDVSDSKDVKEYIPSGEPLTGESEITIKFKIKDFPAYVVVESQGDDKNSEHAIYFDGEKIHDPNPFVGSDRTLNDYHIIRYFPIIKDRSRDEVQKKTSRD